MENLLYLCVLILAYGLVSNRLMHITQPLRIKGISLALEAIDDNGVSKSQAENLYWFVQNVYSPRLAWKIALCAIWFYIFSKHKRIEAGSRPKALGKTVSKASAYLILGSLGMSPAAALLFMLQVIVLLLIGASLSYVKMVFTLFVTGQDQDGPTPFRAGS